MAYGDIVMWRHQQRSVAAAWREISKKISSSSKKKHRRRKQIIEYNMKHRSHIKQQAASA